MKFETHKKKIALFIPDLSMGGTLTLLKSLIKNLHKEFDLFVIVQKCDNVQNLDVPLLNLGTTNTLLSILKLYQLSKAHKFHVIFSFMERANLISYFSNLYLPCHTVLSIHNSPKQAFKHRTKIKCLASQLLYKMIDKQTPVVAVSAGISEELYMDFGLKNVTTIYNSIQRIYGLTSSDDDIIRIVTHCRLVQQKRLDILIDSVHRLRNQHQNFKLLIVGDGPLKVNLSKKIRYLECSDYIEIVSDTDPQIMLHSSQIYLQSSRFEGFGISMLEAMSFGLAVIAVDCDYGPREILKDEYGLLVKNGQREQIVSDISALLGKLLSNSKELEKWRHLAWKRSHDFTSEKVMPSYINLFKNL